MIVINKGQIIISLTDEKEILKELQKARIVITNEIFNRSLDIPIKTFETKVSDNTEEFKCCECGKTYPISKLATEAGDFVLCENCMPF